jgi:hypothetical protein
MSQKANIRSPYYIKFTDPNLTSVSLELFVYEGNVTVDKGAKTYTLESDVIAGTDYVVFEVSDFVRDYISHDFTGSSYDTTPYWFTADATLYNGEVKIREETIDRLAFDSYTGFNDGINAEGERGALITNRSIRIPEGQVYHFPVFSEDTVSVTEYAVLTGASITSTWNAESRRWNVIDEDWDNQSTIDTVTVSNVNQSSTAKVQYFAIDSTVSRLEVATDDNVFNIINTDGECKSKHDWHKLTFINKHGVLQDFFTTGKMETTTQFESSGFNSNRINFSNMTYDTNGGQAKRYNVNSKRSFTVNTGFIHEDEVLALEELIMSENVWITYPSGVTNKVVPTDNTLKLQNTINDKLINVALNFEEAFSNNNTVI